MLGRRCPEATRYIARVQCQISKGPLHHRLDVVKNSVGSKFDL